MISKEARPFIVLGGQNDRCPVVVEENAGAIAMEGARRLGEVIVSLGGGTSVQSVNSADQFVSAGGRAVVLCLRGGTLEKTLMPRRDGPEADGGCDWKRESFLVRAMSRDGGRFLVISGSSTGLFYGAMAVADRLHIDGSGNVVTEETRKMYTPVLEDRMISTFVMDSPNADYDSSQWKEGDDYNWKGFVDWLAGHRINHLMIQNISEAAGLAYPSRRFPQIVNPNVLNVKKEFYGDMIDYAHTRNIKVYLFGFHYPVNALPLIVYPETIAPNCDPANVPEFIPSYGDKKGEFDLRYLLGNYTACLSHPKTREYWKDCIDEVMSMYPQADGLVIGGAEGVDRRDGPDVPPRVCQCGRCRGMENIQARLAEIFQVIYETAMAHKPDLDIALVDRPEYGLLWEHVERQGYDNVAIYSWCCRYPRYPSGFSGKRKKQWDFMDDAWILNKFGGVGHLPKIIRATREHEAGIVNMTYWNREVELAYAAMAEFTWDAGLTFERFAELYTLKTLRRKDGPTSRAVALFAGIMDRVVNPLYAFSFRDEDLPGVMEDVAELRALVPMIPDPEIPGAFFNLRDYLDAFVGGFRLGLRYRNLAESPDLCNMISGQTYERHKEDDLAFFSGA